MIRTFLILFIGTFFSFSIFAQEVSDSAKAAAAEELKIEGNKPVKDPWGCSMIIDNQTTYQLRKGSLDFIIHHRFTSFENKVKDWFGIYGGSNIRLGLNYAFTDWLTLGFGTEKDKQYQEFTAKVKLLGQNRSGSIPVSVTFYGNTCINGRPTATFGDNFKDIDRFSYFSQLMISRKFTDRFSLQVGANFSHFNKVASIKIETEDSASITTDYKGLYQNNVVGITTLGRFKLVNEFSLIAEFDRGFYLNPTETYQLAPKPNLAIGFEKATSMHTFQLFIASSRGIIPQQNFVMNQYDFNFIDEMMIGFNLHVGF